MQDSIENGIGDEPIIFIVDDEEGMRSALRRLFRTTGFKTETFASALDFLKSYRTEQSGCLLLDVHMPDMTGIELQVLLQERKIELPVIFLTGASDIAMAVAAMKAGAEDFLEKPFEPEFLISRVRETIERHGANRRPLEVPDDKLAQLTPREREIMQLVITGKTNKTIARILGTSHRTVETHRARIMHKMQASSLADLVRISLSSRQSGA